MIAGAEHPLRAVLVAAAQGTFPPVDGLVEILPADADGSQAIVEMTGHAYVLTDRSDATDLLADVDAFGGVSDPRIVLSLAHGRDVEIGLPDAVLVRRAGDRHGAPASGVERTDRFDDHPRVRRARHHRREVAVFGTRDGLVTLGAGLVGRTEVSVEVVAATPGRGAGLVEAALAELDPATWVFAQVTPGNVASMRRFLALGFRPIAGERLLTPR